jgi:adenylate kinase
MIITNIGKQYEACPESMRTTPTAAIIILGHSNAGKSPLAALLERNASRDHHRCLHLDFGEHLRLALNGRADADLTPDEIDYIASVMNGRLLDDAHFRIAEKIIRNFLSRNQFMPDEDTLVLNGIPRHIGQARDLHAIGIEVNTVIFLSCTLSVALARKQLADKGIGHEDRSGRTDGSREIFERKIRSFEQETLPLVDYYRSKGVRVVTIDVTADMTPETMYDFCVEAGAI